MSQQYAAHESPVVVESILSRDILKLNEWLTASCFQSKWMQPRLGKSEYIYNLSVVDKSTETEHTPKILGIAYNTKLTYRPHVDNTLKKAYAKIAPVLRIKS